MSTFASPLRPRRSGFTLIELLVVIAIIAILAAILFPVFAQAKEAAKKTQDISNFKQVLLGTMMYMNDQEDTYPLLRWGKANWGCNNGPSGEAVDCIEVHNGANSIEPYIKNRAIWASPNDSIPRNDLPNAGAVNNTGGALSYTYNSYGLVTVSGGQNSPYGLGMVGWSSVKGNAERTDSTHSLNSTAVGAPADTVLMYPYYADFSYWYGQQAYTWDGRRAVFPGSFSDGGAGIAVWPDVIGPGYMGWTNDDRISIGAYSHQTNWGWADGHVRSFDRSQLMDRTWVTDGATALANHLRNRLAYDEAFHH